MLKVFVKGENIINIPNLLSLYRLLAFPVILFMVLTCRESWFVILICISLVSDILDGNIARIFKLQTNFGAALDNLADILTISVAILGMFIFKWTELEPHIWFLYIFLGIFLISYIIAFIRFKKIPGLHLYGAVIACLLQGIFLFVLFAIGFYPWLYYLSLGWGILAYIGKCLVLMKLDDIRIGVKGLYWLLKTNKQEENRL